ncbi:class I SAM-dependent methyltransferase [Chryseolinea lacunae]|uniref:Methyltransferase domain-containing protein n=1 Tax=Chryseolinea lacunae TaxID=2801331 RepID=A0ABS1KUM6_9BACT|nr:methyltransferase domain-containing protein [Chryseolinea lacunae]
MELSVAIQLIKKGIPVSSAGQVWMDLGAGKGLFSHALATLLPEGSTVHAIDKDGAALRSITFSVPGVTVSTTQKDFVQYDHGSASAHGILMANSIHFVSNKIAFLRQLKKQFLPGGRLIIVEYDTDAANAWVPYPIRYASLQKLLGELGFADISKLDETPSRFSRIQIYSAAATWDGAA